MIRDLVLSLAAFVAATLLAELLGAVNLGTALTFGAIAFMGTIVALILVRGPQTGPPAERTAPPAERGPARGDRRRR
jgi:hypothetical protein